MYQARFFGRVAAAATFLFILALSLAGLAQQYRPEQLMILVIGARSDGSDPDQTAVVDRLRALRGQPGLGELKMATMHFDRPREAEFAQKVLGIRPHDLPCLCLVQLDGALEVPTRKLYAIPRITRDSLRQAEGMTQYWTSVASNLGGPDSNGGLFTPDAPDAPGLGASLTQQPPPARPEPRPTETQHQLVAGIPMQPDSLLQSLNGNFIFYFQGDGNLVLYRVDRVPRLAVWTSRTERKDGQTLLLGADGVLRLFDDRDELLWKSSNEGLYARYYLQMQDDGNAVIYRLEGRRSIPVWATKTAGR